MEEEEANIHITNAILKAAKSSIPRGSVKSYTPFWNEELQKSMTVSCCGVDPNKLCTEPDWLPQYCAPYGGGKQFIYKPEGMLHKIQFYIKSWFCTRKQQLKLS